MTDEERAELLARAIDDLISGTESPATSHGLEDGDLQALLDVARDRLESSRATQEEGARYEAELWDRLRARLAPQRPSPPDIDLPRDQHDALSDIISLRMRMAREVFELAESHRDEVWAQLQARLSPELSGAPTPRDIPIEAPDDAEVEVLTRRSLARLAEIASDPVNIRFRERLKRDTTAALQRVQLPSPARRTDLRVAVAAGVLLAVAVIAFAPLPFTGVDDHPAVQLARSLTGARP